MSAPTRPGDTCERRTVSVRVFRQTLRMDGSDWFDILARVSPRPVASIVVVAYIGLLCLHFGPAWDLFDWAVQQRVRQIVDSVTNPR